MTNSKKPTSPIILGALLFFLFLIPISFAQTNEWVNYCKPNFLNGGTGDGVSCIEESGNAIISPDQETLFRDSLSEDTSFGTDFQPLFFDWDLDGRPEAIILTPDGRIRIQNSSMTLILQSTAFPAPISQYLLEAMFNTDPDQKEADKKQLVYVGDINTSDGHFDLLMIDFNGTAITLNKSIPLRDENETSGLLCKDIVGDSQKECMFQERSGIVRLYNATDLLAEDSTINLDVCEATGEGGTLGSFSNGVNTDLNGLLPDIPYGDFDNDGSQDYFFPCDDSILAIEGDATITYNKTNIGSGAGCANVIHGIRLADLTNDGSLEIITTTEKVFGCVGGICGVGGLDFGSLLQVFDSSGSNIHTDVFDCLSSGQQNRITQPMVGDFFDNDGKEEVVVFNFRTSGVTEQAMRIYRNYDIASVSEEIVITDFSVVGADVFTATPMPSLYTLNKPEYNSVNINFWFIHPIRIYDPYINVQIYNFSSDFTPTADFYDVPIPISLEDGGLLFSQDGNTGIFSGTPALALINIDETSESENWHHYQKQQQENNNRYMTGRTPTTGTHGPDSQIRDFVINSGGETSQHLVADLDNNSVKEIYIAQNNFLIVYEYNQTQDIFRLITTLDLGSSINQELNIHKFPTASTFRIIVGHGNNLTQLTYGNNQLSQVCTAPSVGKSSPSTNVRFGTTCHNNYCLATGDHSVSTVDASCSVRSTFNATGNILPFQTLPFVDAIDDNDIDIYAMTSSGDEAAIHHWSVGQETGIINTNEILVDDVWDTHLTTSLVVQDAGDGGSPELYTFGVNLLGIFPLSDHNYAVKSFNVGGNQLWGEGFLTSSFDLRECRSTSPGQEVNVSYFQPAIINHPSGVTAICGACIADEASFTINAEDHLIVGCWNTLNGNAFAQSACSRIGTSSSCTTGVYAGMGAFENASKPTIAGGDFDPTSAGDELLIGNVLVNLVTLQRIRSYGTQGYVFPSAASLIPKGISDIEFILNSNSGIPLTSVFSTTNENSPPKITSFSYAPPSAVCLTVANTSGVRVLFTSEDIDGDALEFNHTLEDGTSTPYTSAMQTTEFFTNFNTSGTKTITINLRDSLNQTDQEIITLIVTDQEIPLCNSNLNEFTTITNTSETFQALGVSQVNGTPQQGFNIGAAAVNVGEQFGITAVLGPSLAILGFALGALNGVPIIGSIVLGFFGFIIAIGLGLVSPLLIAFLTIIMIAFFVYVIFIRNGNGGG